MQVPLLLCVQSNIGLILHAVEEYELSLRFLEHALTLNIRYEPSDSAMVPQGRPKPVTCLCAFHNLNKTKPNLPFRVIWPAAPHYWENAEMLPVSVYRKLLCCVCVFYQVKYI